LRLPLSRFRHAGATSRGASWFLVNPSYLLCRIADAARPRRADRPTFFDEKSDRRRDVETVARCLNIDVEALVEQITAKPVTSVTPTRQGTQSLCTDQSHDDGPRTSPSSTTSIRRPGLPMCWRGSPITRSPTWLLYCPGIGVTPFASITRPENARLQPSPRPSTDAYLHYPESEFAKSRLGPI
jgi:hypothetical protein